MVSNWNQVGEIFCSDFSPFLQISVVALLALQFRMHGRIFRKERACLPGVTNAGLTVQIHRHHAQARADSCYVLSDPLLFFFLRTGLTLISLRGVNFTNTQRQR
jgi:hypothetical protein